MGPKPILRLTPALPMRIDENLKSLSPLASMVGVTSLSLAEANNQVEALRVCAKAEAGAVAVSVHQTVRAGTVFSELEAA